MSSSKRDKRKTWRVKAESGYTVTIQAIYYVVILFVFFALIFDMGNVGFVATVGTEAARMAAQDAAKNINPDDFIAGQEVRLSEEAKARAQEIVNAATAGDVEVISVAINPLATRDVIAVRAKATAHTPILGSLFGLSSISFPIAAFAEPAYGIDEEGQ